MKSLSEICEDMQDEIREKYDLGHGDAEELFKDIWLKMTAGPNSLPVEKCIVGVAETFAI